MLLLTSHVFCITINVYVWYRVRDTTFTSVTGWPGDILTQHVIVCLLVLSNRFCVDGMHSPRLVQVLLKQQNA